MALAVLTDLYEFVRGYVRTKLNLRSIPSTCGWHDIASAITVVVENGGVGESGEVHVPNRLILGPVKLRHA